MYMPMQKPDRLDQSDSTRKLPTPTPTPQPLPSYHCHTRIGFNHRTSGRLHGPSFTFTFMALPPSCSLASLAFSFSLTLPTRRYAGITVRPSPLSQTLLASQAECTPFDVAHGAEMGSRTVHKPAYHVKALGSTYLLTFTF
jgi:hypothetical protein